MSDATSPPKVLEDYRDALLKAELAALLHDLGKLSQAFVASKSDPPGPTFKHHQIIGTGFLPPALDALLKDLIVHIDKPGVLQDKAPFADFIELHHDPSRPVGPLVKQLSAEARGTDGSDSGVDKGTPGRQQKPGTTYLATAFGIEKGFAPEGLDTLRQALADGLDQLLNQLHLSPELCSTLTMKKESPGIVVEEDRVIIGGIVLPRRDEGVGETTNPLPGAQSAPSVEPSVKPIETIDLETLHALRQLIRVVFQQALGETRRAANDVTLWDHSYSVASLYKAALAGMLLDGAYREPREVKWRFFRVGFDGLGLIAKGHTIGDSLGYREVLEEAKDAARDIVEFDWAIGNEVYRDENGVYFVLPALADTQKQDEYDRALVDIIRQKVQEVTDGEVVPVVDGEVEGSRGLTRLGPQITQTDLDVRSPYPADARPTWPEWWTDWPRLARFLKDTQESEKQKPNLGQCDVCEYRSKCAVFETEGDRPQVDGCPVCQARPKCENQVVCSACGQRRQKRVQPWLDGGRQSTIWIDEVADRNDRVAVIIGRFDLTHWLDGSFSHTYLNTFLTRSAVDWMHSIRALENSEDDRDRKRYLQIIAALDRAGICKSPDEISPASLPKVVMDALSYALSYWNASNSEDTGAAATLLQTFLDFGIGKRIQSFLLAALFERAAEDDVQRIPGNLATLLLRKHPSPARLRRIWTTTENFWQRVVSEILDTFSYDRFADPEKPGLQAARTRRVALFAEGVSLPALAYDAEIGPLRLSVYWDPAHKQFITLDNLQLLLEQTGTSSVEEFRNWLGRQKEIKVEEPITGQVRVRALRGEGERRYPLRGVEVLDDNYRPYVSILTTPRTFLVLVPGVDAADIAQAIRQKYEGEFSKVRNRLPLHLGVVYFHRRTPLYAAMDAARRMLPVGCRSAETWTLKDEVQSETLNDGRAAVKLRFNNGITWTVDVTTGDPSVPDDYYPYFLVNAESHPAMVLSVPDPRQENTWRPLVHARELKKGDKVRIDPSLFDFEFLDTIGRRFEVSYAGGKRRPREGLGGPRPYYLDRLADFRRLWWLLSGHYADQPGFEKRKDNLTPTQLSNIETLIGTRAQEWGRGDWDKLKNDETFCQFVKATLTKVGGNWWKALSDTDREELVDAGCDGTLLDVFELYRAIMKIKPLSKDEKQGGG